MTKSLTLSSLGLLALAPLAFASDYSAEGMGVRVGAEAQVSIVDVSWGVTATAASAADAVDNNTAALLATSRISYLEAQDKLPNYAFGGGVTLRTSFAEDFGILGRFSFEAGLVDGKGLLNSANGFLSTNVWKSKMTMAPAVFVTFNDSIGLGVIYDMREYEMTASPVENSVGTATATSAKENQLLLAARGETKYDMDDMVVTVAFEAAHNLNAKADSDVDTYFTNIASQAHDGAGGSAAAVLNTATGVHTSLTKLSASIGFEFANF